MTGTSRVVAGAVVCAVVSLSGVAGSPAQADDGMEGATPTLGRAIGNAGGALGGGVENLGPGGAAGGTGGAVGGTTVGGPAGVNVGGTVGQVTGTVGGTVRSATTTVGGTVHHVVNSAGGRLSQQQPHSSPPTSRPTTSGGTTPDANQPQPGTAAVVHPAAATDTRRTSRHGERVQRVPVSRAAVAAARRLILASVRPEWLHRSAVAGPTESRDVATPTSFYDEACRSASLAIADLRRCARASMLIPELGGPASGWLPLSLAMIGTGLVLVERRRRGAALGTPVG